MYRIPWRWQRILIVVLAAAIFSGLLLVGTNWAALPPNAPPPPFLGSAGDWINSQPLSWGDLSGKVVLVDFMEYTCINCIRTFPYLREWYKRYHPYGFEIIGIHTPEFAFDTNKQLVAEGAKRFGLTYPILNDPQSLNWQLYNEQFWPSKYLFDQNGRLVEQHAGEGNYQETELLIQQLLHRTHPNVRFPEPLAAVRPGDAPGAVCQTDSPEMYANPTRGFLANIPSGWKQDQQVVFADVSSHQEGRIYAKGAFLPRYQSLQHARATQHLEDYLATRYRGSEVNVVVNQPHRKAYRVYVTLDEQSVPESLRGDDMKADARGTYFDVTFPRMYNVIRGPYGVHELRLASDSPEFDFYTFTFSGCPQEWKEVVRR